MRIAFVLPSLINKGPVIVVRDLVNALVEKENITCVIYYLDDARELDFNAETIYVKSLSQIDFNAFDIVHTHLLRPDVFMALRRNKFRKAKLVSTIHSYMKEDLKNSYGPVVAFFTRYIWCRMLNRYDKVVCLSNDMKNYYAKYINPRILTSVYNGRTIHNTGAAESALPETETAAITHLRKDFKIIGGIGNVTRIKGFEQLVQVLAINPKFALIIIGEGIEKENLIQLATELGVQDRCLFLGYKANARDYHKFFDIYAVTSFSEGFSLVLIEAASKGLPTLCSDIPIFKELFSPREVSFYKLYDIEDMSKSLDLLLKNAADYSRHIRVKFFENYTVEAMCNGYLAVYNSLLEP